MTAAVPPPASQPASSAAAPPVAASQPAVRVDLSSPRATLETLHRAATAPDMDAYRSAIDPRLQAAMKDLLSANRRLGPRVRAVAAVVEQRVGPVEAAVVRRIDEDMRIPSPLRGAVRDGQVDWRRVAISVDDDHAGVVVAGRPLPITLHRVGGKWYAVPPAGQDLDAQRVEADSKEAARTIDKWIDRLGELERKVRAGELTRDNFQRVFDRTMWGG